MLVVRLELKQKKINQAGKKSKSSILDLRDKINKKVYNYHLAGIIPISSQPCDFEFPWPDYMFPVGENYLSIHRSVEECAAAGCNSIWIVCDNNTPSILREIIGEYIVDPTTSGMSRKIRPVFYVKMNFFDDLTKKSIPYSIIYGAKVALQSSNRVSKWVRPTKLYVSSPYCLYDPMVVLPYRKYIMSENVRFILRDKNGLSYKDGIQAGFTLFSHEIKALEKAFYDKASVGKRIPLTTQQERLVKLIEEEEKEAGINAAGLELENKYPGRFLEIHEVFDKLDDTQAAYGNLNWYFWCDTWEDIRKFFASKHTLKRTKKIFDVEELLTTDDNNF
jgi:hypothetical protein